MTKAKQKTEPEVIREFHPDPERACRVCGCTETDCRGCIERTGEPCYWVEGDLCSACTEEVDVCACGHWLTEHFELAGACGRDEGECGCKKFRPKELQVAEGEEADIAGAGGRRQFIVAEPVAEGRSARPLNGYPQMLRMIPLDRIVPSPTNPRKHFDPVKLQELADSIIEHGLVEPILVRPRPAPGRSQAQQDVAEAFGIQGEEYYQLVAGERRWRAVKLAGLTVIEAKVRDLNDRAVLEIQFIENLQRADLSAIEEAQGYKRLLDEHGYNAEGLAAKLGKSKSYVYGRLKLCALPAPALEALAKGDLPATIGELIGRLPSMEMREEFWDEEFEGYGSDWFEMPSFRDVKEMVERSYMRELKGAPFSQADKKLVPEAGSCKDCPKRTGNNRAEYPDARADMCTDVPCFNLKVQAHARREAEKAKRAGANVLDESETKKILQGTENSSWLTSEGRQKYFELDDTPWQTDDERTYKELLDGHLTPVVAVDPQGNSHLLAPRAEAEKILKDIHGIKPERERGADTYRKEEQKRQEEKKLRQATAAEIVERALLDVDDELFNHTKFLRLVAKLLIDHGHADVARPIAKRRGIEINAANVRGSVEKIVDGLDDADVPGFVVEWLLQGELESWTLWGSDRDDKFPLCEYFGLKPKVVMKEVVVKQKAEVKAKPKPKAKAVVTA